MRNAYGSEQQNATSAQDLAKRQQGRDAAYVTAIGLTVVVWGWLPFMSGWHYTAPPDGDQYAFWTIWGAALIPAYRACLFWFDESPAARDMKWIEAVGLLVLMSALVLLTMTLKSGAGSDLTAVQPSGNPLLLSAVFQLGKVLGVLLTSSILAAMLLLVGVFGRLFYVAVRSRPGHASPKPNVVMLLVGWAALPATFLLIWVINHAAAA